MRLLLTSHPTSSHLVTGLVPLAQVARALGHEVAVATAGSMAAELARHTLTDPEPRRKARAIQRELLTLPGLEQLVCDLEALPVPRTLSACQSGDLRP